MVAIAGKEGPLLDGRVATTDDCDVLALEERAVTDRAVGDALAGQLLLAGDAELARLTAGGDDHGRRAKLAIVGRSHDPVVTVDRDRRDLGAVSNLAPNFSACFWNLSASSGPMMCSKPG